MHNTLVICYLCVDYVLYTCDYQIALCDIICAENSHVILIIMNNYIVTYASYVSLICFNCCLFAIYVI